MFRKWSQALPAYVEVCPVQLPGREMRQRERLCTDLPALVPVLAEALQPLLDRPFAIFGHSMGAVLGFEWARYLRHHYALTPKHLLMSGGHAPQLPPAHSPLHRLPNAAFLHEVWRRYQGIPEVVWREPEIMAWFLPILRADFTMLETYTYVAEVPFDCPLSAFGGLQDPNVSHDGLVAWRHQVCGPFRLSMFPGGHFFVNEHPEPLLQAISHALQATVSESTPIHEA